MAVIANIIPIMFDLLSLSRKITKAAILDITIIPTFRIGYTTAPLLLKYDKVCNRKYILK